MKLSNMYLAQMLVSRIEEAEKNKELTQNGFLEIAIRTNFMSHSVSLTEELRKQIRNTMTAYYDDVINYNRGQLEGLGVEL